MSDPAPASAPTATATTGPINLLNPSPTAPTAPTAPTVPQGTPQDAPPSQATQTAPQGAEGDVWYTSLPEQERASAERFQKPDDLWKSYRELEKWKGSQDKIQKLPENATDDERQSFYKELGVPELDKYQLKLEEELAKSDKPIPEGEKKLLDGLKETAQKNGIMPDQLDAVMRELRTQTSQLGSLEEQRYQEEATKAIEAFKQEPDFAKTTQAANVASEAFINEEAKAHFKEQSYLGDPKFIKFLAEVGKGMKEDSAFKGEMSKTSSMPTTAQAAQEKIQELMSKPEFFDSNKANHQAVVAQVERLGRVAYPTKNATQNPAQF